MEGPRVINNDCRVVDMDAHPSPSEISVLHIQNQSFVGSNICYLDASLD